MSELSVMRRSPLARSLAVLAAALAGIMAAVHLAVSDRTWWGGRMLVVDLLVP